MYKLLNHIMNYDDSLDVKINVHKIGVAIEIIKYDNETDKYDVVYSDFCSYDNDDMKLFESKAIHFFSTQKKLDKLRDNIKSLNLLLNVKYENGGMRINIIDNMHNVIIFNDFELSCKYGILIDNANKFVKNWEIKLNK